MRKLLAVAFLLFWSQELFAQGAAGQYKGFDCQAIGLASKILRFYRANDTTATGLVATDTTDANGRWDITLPGTGNYRIYVVDHNLWLDRFSFIKPLDQGLDARYAGAIGDGSTDNSTFIQRAIDSSKVVYFAPGTYVYNTGLTMKRNTKLRGWGTTYESSGSVRLQYKGNGWAIKVDTTVGDCSDIGLENITIEGTDSAVGGIRWGADKTDFAVNRAYMNRVLIRRFGKWNSVGLKLEGVTHSDFNAVFLDEIKGIPLFISTNNTVQPGPLLFMNSVFGSGSSPQCSIAVVLYPDSATIHSTAFGNCYFGGARFKGVYIKKGNSGNRTQNLAIEKSTFELNIHDSTTSLEVEEAFALDVTKNNFVVNNQPHCKGIRFTRLNTTDAVEISGNAFVNWAGTGDTVLIIDSAGSVTTNILYGLNNSTAGVTNLLRDQKLLLKHLALATGDITGVDDTLRVGTLIATAREVIAGIHLRANQNLQLNFDKDSVDVLATFFHSNFGVGDQNKIIWEAETGKRRFRVDDDWKFDSTAIFASGANLQTDSILLVSAGDSIRVSNSRVTTGSYILVFPLAAPLGNLYISNREAGSFTVKSNADESSNIPLVYFISKF